MTPGGRAELTRWLAMRRFSFFVTLAFNDPSVTPAKANERLLKWNALLDRDLLGPRWRNKPDERPLCLFFLESFTTNPHWHGLVSPLERHHERFHQLVEPTWKRLVQAGTTDTQIIRDHDVVSRYCTKQISNPHTYEHFVVLNGLG
ncbi:hypothetical protein [Azospirillum sp. sgz302134]